MVNDARQYCFLKRPFELKYGGILSSPVIAFETWGNLNSSKDNGVLIFTGLSPSAHAASSDRDPSPGWWENIVGPNKPIDTNQYFVICANSLGSCFGSTGPASINPNTEEPYLLEFPKLALEDIAASTKEVLCHLGIDSLHAVIGPSMGGMTAMSFLLRHPRICNRLLLISTASASRPFSISLRSLQRMMITSDPSWKSGQYTIDDLPLNGMKLARMLGMITYRSAEEWNQRFGRDLVPFSGYVESFSKVDFKVEQYLHNRSDDFIDNFDPNSYLYLSRAIDLFDLETYGQSVTEALSGFEVDKITIIGVEKDFIFPFDLQLELCKSFQENKLDCELIKLESMQGHDSFLADTENFGPAINSFFI
mgnify:CR=1 FL=1|jgi:homoserine O-acetyltransferase|tara:strand:+ start:1831 stop:2925 length:1095 start_codon:yes stop_codon:yes gene_type:complete